MWHGGWSGADWMLMVVGTLIFWTLVIVVVVWLARTTWARPAPPRPSGSGPDALRILDERYARGELSDEEYRHRRDVLTAR